ncbi:MAG: beta-N-acetylhexosaminidase [Elusimicrobia bacterium]|nr:beta-N-acetylhexosaminidase [Elusimicrobiota bacterium]
MRSTTTVDPGLLFMLGIYGKRPDRATVSLLRETGAGAVLLLARNIDSTAQTRALTSELVQRLGRPILFAVDHEGGWVLRFKRGVTAFPGNAALGRLRDPRLARAVGRQMARELLGLGIGFNLAPVLDVVERYNPGIGIRSFGSDPLLAARLGSAMILGMQEAGLSACAKHFPGKGAARVDAHMKLPVIRLSRRDLERTHLAPFKSAIEAGVDCVMTSHVRMPAFDGVPATFSRKITTGLLREGLGFDGVIVSDDLCMGAVTGRGPVQQAAARTLEAGHDMVIVAHDPSAQQESVDLCRRLFEDGGLDAGGVARSVERVREIVERRRRCPLPRGEGTAAGRGLGRAGRRLGESIADGAVEVVRRGGLPLPLGRGEGETLVVVPDFREVADRFTFEEGVLGPERQVRGLCRGLPGARVCRAPVATRGTGVVAERIKGARRIVFLCFEAMRFAGQRATLRLLNRGAAGRTCACLIRNPWDRELLSPRMTALDSGGYRASQLSALFKRLLGGAVKAGGRASAAPSGKALAAAGAVKAGGRASAAPSGKALAAAGAVMAFAMGVAANVSCQQMTSPVPMTVAELQEAYVGNIDEKKRDDVLARLAATAPVTTRDVQRLFDLFIRFPSPKVRDAAMRSLHLLDPKSPHLDTVFLAYLEEKEAEEVLFGINGALIVRCAACLPKIKEVARRRLPGKDPTADIYMLSEKNVWWAIFEALSALAQWEGKESLGLLKSKTKESPRVAEIMARHLWKESLPVFIRWSSGNAAARERAKAGLSAEVPPAALRESRPAMAKVVRDPKADRELRHQLSIKLGLSSTEAEAAALVEEYRVAVDSDTRRMLSAAVFASRHPQGIPLLRQYVREDPNPLARAGALAQLKGMLGPAEYRELLGWVSKNDPNPDNRQDALEQLREKSPRRRTSSFPPP